MYGELFKNIKFFKIFNWLSAVPSYITENKVNVLNTNDFGNARGNRFPKV